MWTTRAACVARQIKAVVDRQPRRKNEPLRRSCEDGLDAAGKVERSIHAQDAMSIRGVLILPLFCRSDSESRLQSSTDPGSKSWADGIHAYFQLRYEKLIRFPPGGLFLLSPLQCVWSQQRTTLENSTIDLDVRLGSLPSITRTTSRPKTPSTGSTVTLLKVSQSRSEKAMPCAGPDADPARTHS